MNKLLPSIWYRKKGLAWLCLWPFSLIYRLVITCRKACYRFKIFKTHHIPCKVIIVGNHTVGGAGKTPMVKALVSFLKQQGYNVAVICKGYKGSLTHNPIMINASHTTTEVGDEAVELFNSLHVPIVACQDRVLGANYLYEQFKPDIIISDDGLTHYALARDLEIIVEKQGVGLGNKSLLPAGPLREPIQPLQANQLAVTSRFTLSPEMDATTHQSQLFMYPACFISLESEKQFDLDYFKNKTCYTMAGIAHPQTFFDLLQQLGIQVIATPFADHHVYTEKDFVNLNEYPILMTEKDAVKCKSLKPANAYYLQIDSQMTHNVHTTLQKYLLK